MHIKLGPLHSNLNLCGQDIQNSSTSSIQIGEGGGQIAANPMDNLTLKLKNLKGQLK